MPYHKLFLPYLVLKFPYQNVYQEIPFKKFSTSSICKISIKNHNIFIFKTFFTRYSPYDSLVDFIYFPLFLYFNSALDKLYSSSVSFLPCHSALFSIKDIPLPFIVFAIITFGLFDFLAFDTDVKISSKLCPLIL